MKALPPGATVYLASRMFAQVRNAARSGLVRDIVNAIRNAGFAIGGIHPSSSLALHAGTGEIRAGFPPSIFRAEGLPSPDALTLGFTAPAD